MGSRIREKPEHLFEVFVEIANPQAEGEGPFNIQQYPEDFEDNEALTMIPKFAYPCETDASKVDHFTFVLTDIEGKFRFGYCRHATGHQTCLCILSCLPWFEVFFKLLDTLATITQSSDQQAGSGMREFLQATYTQEVPHPNIPVTIVAGENMFNFTSPDPSELPSIPKSRNLTEYYNAVDTPNMMRIFASMVQERRIYMTSKKLSRLTACIHAAESLLYPMHWQHLFIPILPAHLIDYISAPMPYLIGVHNNLLEKLKINRVDIGDAVIVDLDSNIVTSEHEDLESMPEDVSNFLKKSLKTDVVRNSMTKNGDAISVAFLQTLVRLIGGYREALKIRPEEPITFDPEVFVRSRSSQTTQAYLKEMLTLQIFQQFIYGRLEILNSGCGFTDIFEQLATAYADRLNSQSNYKEWLKSVKKGGRKGKEVLTGLTGKAGPMMSGAVNSVRNQGKKALDKLSNLTDHDEKRGSSNSFNVSGGKSYSKKEQRTTKGPARPPPPNVSGCKSPNVEKDESQDDSQVRLSYHTVDVSLMGDHDIQAVMMRSASAEVLPEDEEDLSGSTSTVSSDSRSIDDSDSANIPFGSLQSSDEDSQTNLADLPPVAYKSQSSCSSISTTGSEVAMGDRLILKKSKPATTNAVKPSVPSRPPAFPSGNSSSSSPKQTRESVIASATPLRPPPRKQVPNRQPITQPQSSVTSAVPSGTVQDAPLIKFGSSESETTDSEVFDPLAQPKSSSSKISSGSNQPSNAINDDIASIGNMSIRERQSVSPDKPFQRSSSSRSSLSRSQAFRRDSNTVPLRKGSSVTDDNDEMEDTIDGTLDPTKSNARISAGMSAPETQPRLRRDSSADLMKHEWSLASLAPGPLLFCPLTNKNNPVETIHRQSTLPDNTAFPLQQSTVTTRGPLLHQSSVPVAPLNQSNTGHIGISPHMTAQPYRSQHFSSSIKVPTQSGTGLPFSSHPHHHHQQKQQTTVPPSSSLSMSSNRPTSSLLAMAQGNQPQSNIGSLNMSTNISKSSYRQTNSSLSNPNQGTRTLTSTHLNSRPQGSGFNSKPSLNNPNRNSTLASTTKTTASPDDLFKDLMDIQLGNPTSSNPTTSPRATGSTSSRPPPRPPKNRWETFE